MAKKRGGGGGAGGLVLGFALGALCVGGAGWAYLKLRTPTAKGSGAVVPLREKRVVSPAPASVPKGHEKRVPPFGISEDVFEGGARVYIIRCATCHGVPGEDAKSGTSAGSQFWKKRSSAARKNSSDLYEAVAHGVASTAMPAYRNVLTETELWQVSLLLANAGRELPGPVTRILAGRPGTEGTGTEDSLRNDK